MEELVLNSYWKKRKEKMSLRIAIRSCTKVELTALTVMYIAAIVQIILAFNPIQNVWLMYVAVGIMVISYIVLSTSKRKTDLENSDEFLRKLDERYSELLEWLKSIQFKEKKQIEQLCFRCENYIEELKKAKEKQEKQIYTIATILWIPVFIAIITWLLGLEGNLIEKLLVVVVLTGAVTVVYMTITCFIESLSQIFGGKEQQMKLLINDLHGILDRCLQDDENT